tara:strand:+ start:1189 stop:2052 length:864 start_codon:yes stop_codon:yes gene_type:complete
MILYVQTTAIPRSELHNTGVVKALKTLDKLKHFSEIRWFVNIDNVKSVDWDFEDYQLTLKNFEDSVEKLNKTKLFTTVSKEPCFYLAFRRLTKDIQRDVKVNKLTSDEYCVMWLEDDWYFKDSEGFETLMNVFLNNNKLLVAPLYHNKINMGGNPDIIKGKVFEYFKDVNFDKDNKRDPEEIRKHEVFKAHIWINPHPEKKWSLHQSLIDINGSSRKKIVTYSDWMDYDEIISLHYHTKAHKVNYKVISSNVIEDVGDNWKVGKIRKSWNQKDKSGISADRSYTYKS